MTSAANNLAQEFRHMIRDRDVEALDGWLLKAESAGIAELHSFANGLRSDYVAVKAALQFSWSNGPTEGRVNRLKLIKRQMYGRA